MSDEGIKLHAYSPASAATMGTNGANIISDTASHNGPFYKISAITETVINTATLDSDLIDGSLNGVTLTAGSEIFLYGIESITLTSGTAIAYKM